MGDVLSVFFTAVAFDSAKKAWSSVVDVLITLAGWLGRQAKSFVNFVIGGISGIPEKIKTFFINVWHNAEEFTRRIFNLSQKGKDHICVYVVQMADVLKQAGINLMKEGLQRAGVTKTVIDSLSDKEIEEEYKKRFKQEPLSDADEKLLSGDAPISETTSLLSSTEDKETVMNNLSDKEIEEEYKKRGAYSKPACKFTRVTVVLNERKKYQMNSEMRILG